MVEFQRLFKNIVLIRYGKEGDLIMKERNIFVAFTRCKCGSDTENLVSKGLVQDLHELILEKQHKHLIFTARLK